MKLGVNIDHVATLREARKVDYPSVVKAARIVEEAGADQITIHLREDRRHIRDDDVRALRGAITTMMNLEMACSDDILRVALEVVPEVVCLVPEKREEVTTEGGLDVAGGFDRVKEVAGTLKEKGINVSLFIDPVAEQADAAAAAGADAIEIHTGAYCDATGAAEIAARLAEVTETAKHARGKGLVVNAGHGLRLDNVVDVARIPEIVELNIGHSIVARAVFVGLAGAVREMKAFIDPY